MANDSLTVSNDFEEVAYVAMRFGTFPSTVYKFKELYGNNRKELYFELERAGYKYGPDDNEDFTDDGGEDDTTPPYDDKLIGDEDDTDD